MVDQAYVYIMASTYKHLYIGVTSEIELRVLQHKHGRYPDSFTSKYCIDKLVYFERFGMIEDAIARETQLKKWSRIKKIQLIVAGNPTWRDLSSNWGKPFPRAQPFLTPQWMSGVLHPLPRCHSERSGEATQSRNPRISPVVPSRTGPAFAMPVS